MLAIWPDQTDFDADQTIRDAIWTDLTGMWLYQHYDQRDRTKTAYEFSSSTASVRHTDAAENVVLVRSKGIMYDHPKEGPLVDVWRVITKDEEGHPSVDQDDDLPEHLSGLGERMTDTVEALLGRQQ